MVDDFIANLAEISHGFSAQYQHVIFDKYYGRIGTLPSKNRFQEYKIHRNPRESLQKKKKDLKK